MASTPQTCSIDGCKRAIVCLCRHCEKNVCRQHFSEHQTEVNNQLIPITDRLNELKMRLQIDRNSTTSPLAIVDKWRQEKYKEIDREYNRRVRELEKEISKQDDEISRMISAIQELISEDSVSIDQVRQMQENIDRVTNQVDKLFGNDESDLVENDIQLGGHRYRIRGRFQCQNTDLYALESEKSMAGYDGRCPICGGTHVIFETNRGMYASVKALQRKYPNIQ